MKAKVLMVAALFVLSACGNDNPADPLAGFEPQIDNATDNFQLQASDVTDVGTVLQYTWANTGNMASVDHSTTTAAALPVSSSGTPTARPCTARGSSRA